MTKFNPQQRDAIRYVDGPLLVLAGAGSGKTSVIVEKIKRLTKQGLCEPEQIAAITFTNKAAKEMLSRLPKRRDQAGPWISTFHTLGLRILRREYKQLGYKPGFSIIDARDGEAIIADLLRRESASEAETVKRVNHKISQWKSDLINPNDTMPELLDQLDNYDQVVGARRTEEGTVKFLRKPAKWFIRRLATYLSGTKIPDLNSGFRAFRRDVALQFLYLLPAGFSCVTTITMTFLSNGYSIKYVPIDYAPRAGESKFHWWKDTRRYLLQVVRMVLSYSPLKVLMPPAILLGLVGTGKLIFDLFDKNFRIGTNTIVILGVAVSLALLAMLADLLVQLNKKRHDVLPATLQSL